MNKYTKAFSILVSVFFYFTSFLFAVEKPTIAILQLEANNISEGEARGFTDKLRSELFKTEYFIILERNKMEDILIEQGLQQSGCITDECVVEFGEVLGVKFMIAGSINKIGSLFNINVRFINVETSKNEFSVEYDYEIKIEEIFKYKIGEFSKGIVQEFKNRMLGSLEITSNIDNISVYMSGKLLGVVKDSKLYSSGIIPGNYVLKCEGSDVKPYSTSIEILKGERTVVNLLPTAIYGKFEIKSEDGSLIKIKHNNKVIATTYTSYENNQLIIGEYLITIDKQDWEGWSRWVNIEENKKLLVNVPLKKKTIPLNTFESLGFEIRPETVYRSPAYMFLLLGGGFVWALSSWTITDEFWRGMRRILYGGIVAGGSLLIPESNNKSRKNIRQNKKLMEKLSEENRLVKMENAKILTYNQSVQEPTIDIIDQ